MESETILIDKLKDFKVKSVTVADLERYGGAYIMHYGRPIKNGLIYRPGYVAECRTDRHGRHKFIIRRAAHWYL